MPESARDAPVSPTDYQRLSTDAVEVVQHRLVVAGEDPVRGFVQLLKLRRHDRNSAPEPTILVWCFLPPQDLAAFWLDGDFLPVANNLVKNCEQKPPEGWKTYLLKELPGSNLVRTMLTGMRPLREIVDSRHQE